MDKKVLKQLPNSHGIYQFFNKNGKIIYIGKSVNLKSRVNSYFNGTSKLNFAKQKMVKQIVDIKTILTNNETESLILETTLIKKYEPKYNILMKDGKNHIYIKITDEEFPKIIKTRVKNKKGIYFGPYISTYYVSQLLKLLKTIFGYGVGEHNFFLSKNSYNLDKYIFKNEYKIEDYHKIIEDIKNFLKGNTYEIKTKIETLMKQKAKDLKFEEANKLKSDLEAISILEEQQIVREGISGDYNVINNVQKFGKSFLGMIEIRDSKITGFYNYDIKNNLSENQEEMVKYITEQVWSEYNDKNIISILPFEIDTTIMSLKYEVPKIGTKKELLDMCYKNIYEYACKSHLDSLSTKGFTKITMNNILDILGYKQINKSIVFECNDISHISGNHTVASRSIIENGKSTPSKYRKFNIRTLQEGKIDDFNSMREVMTRRIKEIEKTGYYPDLIIIDGGKGQLSSVVEMIEESGLEIQTVGIAKKQEELFLPGKSKSILLEKDSNELHLIQKIRDEAHRFAITFNRDKRIKSMKKNILEQLPGFGPVTRKKILKNFGNIQNLSKVNQRELKGILTKTQIETLENHGII